MIMLIRPQDYSKIASIARAVGARAMSMVEPRQQNEDARRKEFILNIILTISIILLSILEGTIVWNYITITPAHYSGISPWTFSLIIAAFISMFAISRRGYAHAASYMLIFLYIGGMTYGGILWGVSLPTVLLTITLIIVTSGALISSSFGLWSAGAMIIALGLLGIHEQEVLYVPSWHHEPISVMDMVAYAALFMFIGFISWLSNRETDRSLDRARKSEALLQAERDTLEEKVSVRTREFVAEQEKRMREMREHALFGNLSEGLIHDLMSPLSVIQLYVERLTSAKPGTSPINDDIRKMGDAAKRLGTYISNVKTHMRMSNDRLGRETTDLELEIGVLRDIFGYKAREIGADIEFAIKEGSTMVPLNQIHLHRLLCNLVSNALDACAATVDGKRKVLLSVHDRDETLTLEIYDTGCGMPSRFVKERKISDEIWSTKVDGVGIGLKTVKHIVEQELGGSISVGPNTPRGTVFTITIPYTYAQNDRPTSIEEHPEEAERVAGQ